MGDIFLVVVITVFVITLIGNIIHSCSDDVNGVVIFDFMLVSILK